VGPAPRVTLTVFAAAIGASGAYLVLTLPPPPIALDGPISSDVVFGAFHIHSNRSDGSGSVDVIAAAAARANLSFVVLTDHGDGTRPPDPPRYVHGVLCLDEVEVNTAQGHLVALGLSEPSPYPLAGRAEDVAEDVHRMGGWTVAAHPDSPQASLRWRGGLGPADGVEWLSVDSEWRDEPPLVLLGAASRSLFRAPAAIATLFDRPEATLRRWDMATRTRRVVGLAAVDAHARVGSDTDGRSSGRLALRWPGYESLFRTVVQGVELDGPLTGEAGADGARVLQALADGRTFSLVRAYAEPAALDFHATSDGSRVPMGGRIAGTGRPVALRAAVSQAPGATLVLVNGGVEVRSGRGALEYSGDLSPGAYRVEARLPGHAAPWIVSNPVYVGASEDRPQPPSEPPPGGEVVDLSDGAGWVIEQNPTTRATLTTDAPGTIQLAYALGNGPPAGQYAALARAVPPETGFDRITFSARASQPMRLSVQIRLPGTGDAQRWRRSVYVDTSLRAFDVPLSEMEPVGRVTSQRPVVARINSVLFVVDTLNTSPGSSGHLWISAPALGVGRIDPE